MRVLLFGTFDHLHPGHDFVFQEAFKKSDDVHVIVARDSTVERIKSHTPDHNEQERIQNLIDAYSSLTVHLGDSNDYLNPVRTINPDLILLGYDQHMPPSINESDLPCRIERLPAFEPNRYKSSIVRKDRM